MKKIQFAAVLLIAALSCCAQSASNSVVSPSAESENASASKGRLVDGGGGGGGGGIGNGSGSGSGVRNSADTQEVSLNQAENTQTAPTVIERKIIRNADLQLESDSPEEAQRKIAQIAESKRGFVVESSQTASDVKAATREDRKSVV